MEKEEFKAKIETEEDYIRSPKFSNSLEKFLNRNSEGVENSVIARVLMLTEEEVEKIHQEAIQMLRDDMVEGE